MKKRIQTLVKLGIFTAVVMHLLNKAVESSALARNLLKTRKDHFYDWRNGSVYYTRMGSGAPILLIHDLQPSSSLYEWSEIIGKLAENHTVYALDLPGCGRSDKPAMTYTNYFYVQLVHDFITEIVGEKCDIVSTGISSSFVIMAAHMHKDLIGKITMVNPLSLKQLALVPDRKSKSLMFLVNCPIIATSVYYLLTSEDQIEYDFSEKYFYNPFHVGTKTMHTYYEAAHTKGGAGRYLLASLNSNYVNFDIKFALSKLENEILIIRGGAMDNAASISEAYQQIQPSIQISFVDKAKMLPQLEAPEEFVSLMS